MSILSALRGGDVVHCFEQAFGAKDLTSGAMQQAIKAWFALYFEGQATKEEDSCQRLPVAIVNKLCKAVFGEYSAAVPGQGVKQQFMAGVLAELGNVKGEALQQALVGGECFLKPILHRNGFAFAVVRRDCFVPLARDMQGNITGVGSAAFTAVGNRCYTLLERRTVGEDGRLTIESKLYCAENGTAIGTQVPLGELPQYAALQPTVTLPLPLHNVGMVQVKTPLLNCVDGSRDGVAVYAPAVGLIQCINRNERQLNNEFENGASRIFASGDLLTTDGAGKQNLSETLFVGMDDDPTAVGVTIFSPPLREQSYLARKNEYLRNVESLIGFKRGILSEVEAAERTATEITSSAGDYNLTIVDFQQMWERALREALRTCSLLGQMYRLCDGTAFDPACVGVDWGDGVLYNRDKTWTEYLQMVQGGLLKPELALAWYFNLPHKTPQELEHIRQAYLPQMEELTGGEA